MFGGYSTHVGQCHTLIPQPSASASSSSRRLFFPIGRSGAAAAAESAPLTPNSSNRRQQNEDKLNPPVTRASVLTTPKGTFEFCIFWSVQFCIGWRFCPKFLWNLGFVPCILLRSPNTSRQLQQAIRSTSKPGEVSAGSYVMLNLPKTFFST